uniref:Retroviral polymerase SH3-like domain-containing protein n=1 Tax=Lactuca sativa TaxID=4236 RepID=A0A9R1VGC2_LACSA|nr:hypothetical protein LSAT_V11C500244250 [Lactuca sativa]
MKSVFNGYPQNNKAYRLLDDESGVVGQSKDVEFFEDKFSKDDENSNNTKSISTSDETLPPPPIEEKPMRSTRSRIDEKSDKRGHFSINLDDDPKIFTKAMTSSYAPLWKKSKNDEMDSIMSNGTWVLADLPKGRRPIGSRWIFKRKYHPNGSIVGF